MNIVREKVIEALASILPIFVIVLLINFFIHPLGGTVLTAFVVGTLIVYVGLAIFLIGVDTGIGPIGTHLGRAIAKSGKIVVVVGAGLLLGFFISIAEPDLMVLAQQVSTVTGGTITTMTLLVVVSLGVALLIAIGLLRIVFSYPLYKLLTIVYVILFTLVAFSSPQFIAIAFDASGATTGALTVPFILALALGAAMMKRDRQTGESDSFGLVGLASAGAIFAVLVMSVLTRQSELRGELPMLELESGNVLLRFLRGLPEQARGVAIALTPIVGIFLLASALFIKLRRQELFRIMVGVAFTFVGLVLFMTGVNYGFMDVGALLGAELAGRDNPAVIIVVAFVLGLVTILAEPAVHVLTRQIEDVTSGYVKRSAVFLSLSIAVGLATMLSVIRILVPDLTLLHYLIPGYIVAIVLMYRTPKLFVGIAFDSGGVASGPMTATFILAFAQGAAQRLPHADVMIDGFGIIAMVAMAPLIALQLLGLVFKRRSQPTREPGGSESVPEGSMDDGPVGAAAMTEGGGVTMSEASTVAMTEAGAVTVSAVDGEVN
ncbi:MAG: DUF1538 domain-containing protein [Bacillota bacterium]|nr:DUF1538 domain-containing protein [Bacillota bacterium]